MQLNTDFKAQKVLGKDTGALLTTLLVKVFVPELYCSFAKYQKQYSSKHLHSKAVRTGFLSDLIGLQLMHMSE